MPRLCVAGDEAKLRHRSSPDPAGLVWASSSSAGQPLHPVGFGVLHTGAVGREVVGEGWF